MTVLLAWPWVGLRIGMAIGVGVGVDGGAPAIVGVGVDGGVPAIVGLKHRRTPSCPPSPRQGSRALSAPYYNKIPVTRKGDKGVGPATCVGGRPTALTGSGPPSGGVRP